jgi:ABC-type lipoprotein release transport system permease subunit
VIAPNTTKDSAQRSALNKGRPQMAMTSTNCSRWRILMMTLLMWLVCEGRLPAAEQHSANFATTVRTLAALQDRSTGTPGNAAAAQFIKDQLASIGYDTIGTHRFAVPVRYHAGSRLEWPDRGRSVPLYPFKANTISPGGTPASGIAGPMIYAGKGGWQEFNGKPVADALVVMEIDSGRNWMHAANLGAKGLIYLDRGTTAKAYFEEKIELTPIDFPRFWIPYDAFREFFGDPSSHPGEILAEEVRLTADIAWKNVLSENIYCLVPGTDQDLAQEAIIVEAFYDSRQLVFGQSPGADEACGIATLLDLARHLKTHPPARSIILVATSGHDQVLAGMRELIWALNERSRNLRELKKELRKIEQQAAHIMQTLETAAPHNVLVWMGDAAVREAIHERIKTEVDHLSQELMQLRMQRATSQSQQRVKQLADRRFQLRRIGWQNDPSVLTADEHEVLAAIAPQALRDQRRIQRDASQQLSLINSAGQWRALARGYTLKAVISLHLSSHGSGFGAFERGWLYALKPKVNRWSAFRRLDEAFKDAVATGTHAYDLFQDTLRPNQLRSWQSYFIDRPAFGGEVSTMAGLLGVTIATVNDARQLWGTPHDQPDRLNWEYAQRQSMQICHMLEAVSRAPQLDSGKMPRNGFATLNGRVNFIRHGELFPDQPAPGTVLLIYQGPANHHIMVDALGRFRISGLADKKHVFDKAIIEGYRFDTASGQIIWAIDKKQTGKAAYRVKMQRRNMETDLVMFGCRQTTVFNLLEPRSFQYMTQIQLIDGRREAPPARYWWSRIDTRRSVISALFLSPGTPLKLTLSDVVTDKKLILTNADPQHPNGRGYRVDDWPNLYYSEYKVAHDMWTLLKPRIDHLEQRGIVDDKIRALRQEGLDALQTANLALREQRYDAFHRAATTSWALASRVYRQVDETQKDVLFGVLFYIALFVPFAFCLERLVFSYTNIHKRIIAFSLILILLVIVIYNVHPAFQLAYSPTVVILAFFIMGLSLIVTLIIFFRFENEMLLLQKHAGQLPTEEISRWKAFAASFFLGVNNLRRRRLRTVLTCTTLVILTFTIMSFTTVKSIRHHARVQYQPQAPYHGFLMKNLNWKDLPVEALETFVNTFQDVGIVAPRVWLETRSRIQATAIPVGYAGREVEAKGLVGLSAAETEVTAPHRALQAGRWLQTTDQRAVIIPARLADILGLRLKPATPTDITLWGMPFEVVGIIDGQRYQAAKDLDGEPLTPVTFPSETSIDLTEVEMEAMESGEDIQAFQSRYQHTDGDLTLIVPYTTLLALGGNLKGVAVRAHPSQAIEALGRQLVDRFRLSVFSGETSGTYVYNASDAISYSGVPNILIPMLISVFIVLNTMIGSVYERKREIGIYTSVGLAPSHVSFLFIAESMAFAVLSVVIGYLLAQISASLFAGTVLWAGITVNYSSLAGVAAMLLVILVVLISAIYPSRVAAEIAIPDVNRSWSMPDPHQSAIELTLPFFISLQELRSAGGFVYDYFTKHQDVSHGLFSTADNRFEFYRDASRRDQEKSAEKPAAAMNDLCLKLESRIWLAPFDFGIMQHAQIIFHPAAEEPDFLEIKVHIKREAGEAITWGRVNKAFINQLRKQLLIWRSLNDEARVFFQNRLASRPNA